MEAPGEMEARTPRLTALMVDGLTHAHPNTPEYARSPSSRDAIRVSLHTAAPAGPSAASGTCGQRVSSPGGKAAAAVVRRERKRRCRSERRGRDCEGDIGKVSFAQLKCKAGFCLMTLPTTTERSASKESGRGAERERERERLERERERGAS
eukprot:6185077-Pleurochrysis_carterae.AAC.1